MLSFSSVKFFRDIGTIRLNEVAKLYGVYDRNENKATRVKRMADLPNAQDIIFYEIMVANTGQYLTWLRRLTDCLRRGNVAGREKARNGTRRIKIRAKND